MGTHRSPLVAARVHSHQVLGRWMMTGCSENFWYHRAASYRRMCSGEWRPGPAAAVAGTVVGRVCQAQVRLWKLAVGQGWVHGATWCSS